MHKLEGEGGRCGARTWEAQFWASFARPAKNILLVVPLTTTTTSSSHQRPPPSQLTPPFPYSLLSFPSSPTFSLHLFLPPPNPSTFQTPLFAPLIFLQPVGDRACCPILGPSFNFRWCTVSRPSDLVFPPLRNPRLPHETSPPQLVPLHQPPSVAVILNSLSFPPPPSSSLLVVTFNGQ